MKPFEFLQYVALEQLDALAVDGRARVMAGFSNIADEAEEYANRTFESYMQSVGEADPGDFAEEARDQAVEYYGLLEELRQSMLNLLAVGVYHLYEQHQNKLKHLLMERGDTLPALDKLQGWTKVDELRLLANTVKHAEGSSAKKLQLIRPDLFVPPLLRDSPLGNHIAARSRTENPLGGKDLFVTENDIQDYRDAIRQLWESARSLV